MGALPVNNDSGNDRAFVEQSIHMHHEQNGGTNGILHEEQCQISSEEDNPRSKGVAEYGNGCPSLDIRAHDGFQIQPQQSQGSQQPLGPTVLWERFLPIKTVKVLLVENDDSTRQVVKALLRNCGYEVTAVANGIQAWRTLEDPTDQVDLVLTEVVMPLLSGIGLLSKIMGHKTLKNIPVIMMSCHDSMGIVFKCLSKGAVDFLVKPIRKNELKNLWQHVWRRCHSSSGSGSESVTHTQRSKRLRSNEDSDTNNSSSEEQDNGSNALSTRNGSDDGSGTQSSWTKKMAEVDSPKLGSPSNEWADAPDSTCAQVVYMGAEIVKMDEEEPGIEKAAGMGKDARRASRCQDSKHGYQHERCQDSEHGYQHERCQDSEHKYQHDRSENASSVIEPKPFDKGQFGLDLELGGKSRSKECKMAYQTANCLDVQTESTVFDTRDGTSRISHITAKADCESKKLPSLELTLRRLEGVGDSGKSVLGDHKVLRHSDLSAFSKFNATSLVNQGQAGTTGSCPAFDNCSVAVRTERDFPSCSLGTPYRQSNTSSSNHEFVLSGKTPIKPEVASTFKSSESSAFQPVQHGYMSSSWQELSGRENDACSDTIQPPSTSPRSHIHIRYHHHHHHHHYHHHLDSLQKQQQQQQPDQKDLSRRSMAAAAPQCGSSNAFQDNLEGNTGNYSVSGSVSGSNHGSNGNAGSKSVPNDGEDDKVKDDGVAGHTGDGGVAENVNGVGLDEERIALREAALSKFRQKRKERCFEKRVRYESRKKLAEQRPRVRGQFVRQITSDSKTGDDCRSNDSISKENSGDSIL